MDSTTSSASRSSGSSTVSRKKNKDTHNPDSPDFWDKFIDIKMANPDTVGEVQIISWLMVNTIAGADTTTITIRSTFYFSLKQPSVWKRLTNEIHEDGLEIEEVASY